MADYASSKIEGTQTHQLCTLHATVDLMDEAAWWLASSVALPQARMPPARERVGADLIPRSRECNGEGHVLAFDLADVEGGHALRNLVLVARPEAFARELAFRAEAPFGVESDGALDAPLRAIELEERAAARHLHANVLAAPFFRREMFTPFIHR